MESGVTLRLPREVDDLGVHQAEKRQDCADQGPERGMAEFAVRDVHHQSSPHDGGQDVAFSEGANCG
eukprot:CAMPEP_0194757444 /NCGR_PEP_ID=MMETSP0323_2-20130528/10934_1 /TAXON_ID=2866 ORGANISM="Crypthecodinium cohnii, Strain Seligo" /NCGR_SAMPLE_ID=MMETSP0323_2 /ASSEMBLY_ACC=CAM_ASM_000346 /LENGTH=66 /DNA_ID=CAMNT_0039677379 /DNA_START=1343 /DNA_END=1543 /DNA_ORIENTATION=+